MSRPPTIDASVSLSMLGSDVEALDRRLAVMTAAGCEIAVLVADRRGPISDPATPPVDPAEVLAVARRHPGRIVPALGVEPIGVSTGIGELRAAFDEGFRVAHVVPHAFGLPPDHRRWYPLYGLCAELGIPVQVELGVRPSPGVRVRSVGRPIDLDVVACDFPDLDILGVGAWPWVEEAISMAYKHPNLRITLGGDDPGGAHPSLVRFADSWGVGNVLFASGGADLEAAVARLDGAGLRSEADRVCRREAAMEFLGFTSGPGR